MVIKDREVIGGFEIDNYYFQNLQDNREERDHQQYVSKYVIRTFDDYEKNKKSKIQPIIKRERIQAKKSGFIIAPIVEEFRGMGEQREKEYNARLEKEVRQRIEAIRDEWRDKGYAEGRELALKESNKEFANLVDEKINKIEDFIQEIVRNKGNVLAHQKYQISQLVKILTKWVLLREIDRDGGEYIQRLLEKLILELDSKENLLIKVNESNFLDMPEVVEKITKRLGDMKNLRIEIDRDLKKPGLIIESIDSVIDGGLDTQLERLEKLFATVEENDPETLS